MQRLLTNIVLSTILFSTISCGGDERSRGREERENAPIPENFWVTAYVDYWNIKESAMPLDLIDWTAFTHFIHFACGVDNTFERIRDSRIFLPPGKAWFTPATEVVAAAHAHNVPILIAIGGAGNEEFAVGIEAEHRTRLIEDMLYIYDTYRYDGWDIDLEPVRAKDTANLRAFIYELYDSLSTRHAWYDTTKRPLLTAAIVPSWQGELFATLEHKLDQINVMTYDMGGLWFGKTWHNNAILSRGTDGRIISKDVNGAEMTTVQKRLEQQLDFGSRRNKLGIGLEFYGYVWSGGTLRGNSGEGVSEPDQRWSTPPEKPKYTDHWKLYRDYIDTARSSYRWDESALAPYIKRVVPDGDPTNEQFISFQDEVLIKHLVRYARDERLGGMIIYDLGGGFLESTYPERDRLLQAVKKAVAGIHHK